MESKEAKELSSKMPEKKKKTPISKKKPKVEKNKYLDELISSQINLYKTCNELLGRINSVELQLERISHYNARLTKENYELKNFLDTLAKKMIDDRAELDYGPEGLEPPPVEKILKKKIKFSKKAPLHDDVTKACNACGVVNHINEEKCPKCGLKK